MSKLLRLLFVCLGVMCCLSTVARGQTDPQRALYNDPVRFNKLSGAARSLLQRRFSTNVLPASVPAGG